MQYSSDKEKRKNKTGDLEQRLTAYYGPPMREQPLPQDAWRQLHRKLNKSARRRTQLHRPVRRVHRSWFRRTHFIPEYVRTAFNHVAYDARVSYPASLLHCTFKSKLRAPAVSITPLRRQPIRLLLPVDTEPSLSGAGLDALLAVGIARYQLVKNALVVYLLLAGFVIIGAGTAFFYTLHNRSLVPVLIVGIGGASLFFLLDRQRRHLCYVADALAVLWLGRNRMCEGLHMLANATHSPHRGRWGEPALAERITRVCGTRVESRNERLTMVR